jgi:hypothetical protein
MVADVAGGHGELSFWLHEFGKRPVIIDPRDATFPRWIHRKLRKRAIGSGRLTQIERWQNLVEDVDLSSFDLVVALHPDEATEPALRAAIAYNLSFAIVPCCVHPLDGIKRSSREWLDYLACVTSDIQIAKLPISGANVVLWRHVT